MQASSTQRSPSRSQTPVNGMPSGEPSEHSNTLISAHQDPLTVPPLPPMYATPSVPSEYPFPLFPGPAFTPVLSLLRTVSHLPSLVSRRGLVYGPILIGRLSNTLEETPFKSSSERPQRLFKSFAKRARDTLPTSFGTMNRSGGKETLTTFHRRIFLPCPRVHHGLGLI